MKLTKEQRRIISEKTYEKIRSIRNNAINDAIRSGKFKSNQFVKKFKAIEVLKNEKERIEEQIDLLNNDISRLTNKTYSNNLENIVNRLLYPADLKGTDIYDEITLADTSVNIDELSDRIVKKYT